MSAPHLLFITILYVAALVTWVVAPWWPWKDTGAVAGATVVAGLAAGALIGAWT